MRGVEILSLTILKILAAAEIGMVAVASQNSIEGWWTATSAPAGALSNFDVLAG